MRPIVIACLIVLAGCFQFVRPIEETIPTPASSELTPTVTPSVDVWESLLPGLERRSYRTVSGGTILQSVRIDPNLYDFRAHYRPGDPLTIDQWREALPAAQVIVNTNFFTPEHTILGLLISDGVRYGQSYTDRGGTFYVQDGGVGIRSNLEQPYAGEAFAQAIQAFPMLVLRGQQAYSRARDLRPARRTVIAQDAQGRIVLLATPGFGISLFDLSAYLPGTDLQLVTALNLDGGGSTMMSIVPADYTLRSIDPVPAVLAVYQR